jgi:SAM-dependent methyltransferase
MKDLFGKAILDFQTNNAPEDIITETSISDADAMRVDYLFRSYHEMPKLEQKALQLAHGKVLDIGCGAGSHSLYLQNDQSLEVVAIDISPNAIRACELRGLKNAKVQDVFTLKDHLFDTLLLLMNGTGICGTVDNLSNFLLQLKSLLAPNGQILIDSSDIIYMFDDDEVEALQKQDNTNTTDSSYYGEITFNVSYKGEKETPFGWLFVDYNLLERSAAANGLHCERIMTGDNYDYLARLSI